MTIATELARRIRAFAYEGLPDAALEWAKTGILDTVGVTLAGSAEPCAQIMLRVCTATGLWCLAPRGACRLRTRRW